jgi:PAS domain S-box-containing protein
MSFTGQPQGDFLTRKAVDVGSTGGFLLAALALAGWQLDFALLRAPVPGAVEMNPLTAVCLAALSASLWVLSRPQTAAWTRHLAHGLAASVVAIGLLKILCVITGAAFPLDQVLFRDALRAAAGPNRMAPNTAAALLLLGLGLLALDRKAVARWQPAQFLHLSSLLMAVMALLGYAYGARAMYGIASFIPMAPNTAMAIFLLSAGALLSRPDRGLCRLVFGDTPGGSLVRRVLPTAVILPIVLGWMRLVGQEAGLFTLEIGVSLTVLVTIVLIVAVVWLTARDLDAADLERRRAQEELASMRIFLDSIVENLPDMVFVKDARELRFVRLNRAAEELLGCRREDLLGKSDHDCFPREQADSFTSTDRQVLSSGTLLDIAEETITTTTGEERRLHTKKVPISDERGEPLYLLGISQDVTARREAEERILALHAAVASHAEQLEVANRELEAFSYSVSHDLRAPLRHIDGFADLLLQHAGPTMDEKAVRYLGQISDSARTMGCLIDDLLVFSRMARSEMQTTTVGLDELVRQARHALAPEMEGRRIEWTVAPLPVVHGDAAMLRLVFANLLGNAVKYTRTRTAARIEIGTTTAGSAVTVFVRDNGVGFDMEYAHKLFGVFQRLHRHDEFEGTGIGLANVRRIVQRHGGRTWAEGRLDEGATFYFSLPRGDAGAAETREAA